MVAPEVLRELQPYVGLADGLGRAAVQLVEDSGFADVFITYHRCGAAVSSRTVAAGICPWADLTCLMIASSSSSCDASNLALSSRQPMR